MNSLTKEQIRVLPLFEGVTLDEITIVTTEQGSLLAINKIVGCQSVGFDTESKPTFKKGEVSTGPQVIQLSCTDETFIFPTRSSSTKKVVLEILGNENIKKVGFGLKEDVSSIFEMFGVKVVNTIELSTKVRNFTDVKQPVGARRAVAMLLGQRLTKGAQKSNWSRYPLSDAQIRYAANDSFAALCIENHVESNIAK